MDRVDANAATVTLCIGLIYFVPAHRTDAYGTVGARVELATSSDSSPGELDLLREQVDRDLLRFEFDFEPPLVHLSVIDTSIWNSHDFRPGFDPEASRLAWMF